MKKLKECQFLQLSIVTDARFFYGPWGLIGESGRFGQGFFEEAFSAFSSVVLVARMKKTAKPPRKDNILKRFQLFPLPMFQGGKAYIANLSKLIWHLNDASKLPGIFLLRLPGFIPTLIWPFLIMRKRPYAVEIIGFVKEAMRTSGSTFLQILAPFMERLTQLKCSRAIAASYVTSHRMPLRYPCPGFSSCIADTRVRDFSLGEPKMFEKIPIPLRLLHIGTMNTLYKGQSILLTAMRLILDKGVLCYCTFVGDGTYRPLFERQASELGIEKQVKFVGYVSGGNSIAEIMDNHDILVVNSLTEGLPNVVIEGMMRGIPIIASNVGGIPELIEPDCLVKAGDSFSLANKILDIAYSPPNKLTTLSRRNIAKAEKYLPEKLIEKRIRFYTIIRDSLLKRQRVC